MSLWGSWHADAAPSQVLLKVALMWNLSEHAMQNMGLSRISAYQHNYISLYIYKYIYIYIYYKRNSSLNPDTQCFWKSMKFANWGWATWRRVRLQISGGPENIQRAQPKGPHWWGQSPGTILKQASSDSDRLSKQASSALRVSSGHAHNLTRWDSVTELGLCLSVWVSNYNTYIYIYIYSLWHRIQLYSTNPNTKWLILAVARDIWASQATREKANWAGLVLIILYIYIYIYIGTTITKQLHGVCM